MTLAVEIAGWAGALLILAAYILLSNGRLTAKSPLFHWMNAVGAAGFVANGLWNGALPSAALNVVWIGIALHAVWRIKSGRA